MLSPGDVIVVDVMDIDNVLMVVFVVGSETILDSAEMINIMQNVGPRIAQELQDALMSLVSQPYFTKGHWLYTVIIGLVDSIEKSVYKQVSNLLLDFNNSNNIIIIETAIQ